MLCKLLIWFRAMSRWLTSLLFPIKWALTFVFDSLSFWFLSYPSDCSLFYTDSMTLSILLISIGIPALFIFTKGSKTRTCSWPCKYYSKLTYTGHGGLKPYLRKPTSLLLWYYSKCFYSLPASPLLILKPQWAQNLWYFLGFPCILSARIPLRLQILFL